jgi:hypothetical protein
MEGFTDEEVGQIVKLAFSFFFYGNEDNAINLPEKSRVVWAVIRKDLQYQKKHKRAWRFPEDEKKAIRNSAEYAEWRKNVFERDHYTCKACGRKGGEINAHHIKHFAKYPELRLELSNGVTLCKKCHKKVHRGDIQCPTVS